MNTTIVLIMAAGVAIVAQNLLMARVAQTVSTIVIALLLNAVVGLTTLAAVLIGRRGWSGIVEAVGAITPWSLLPGLLGTFFVFAVLSGYRRMGAASTVAILVASQLVAGLVVDMLRAPVSDPKGNAVAVFGACLLVVGAVLVLRRSL